MPHIIAPQLDSFYIYIPISNQLQHMSQVYMCDISLGLSGSRKVTCDCAVGFAIYYFLLVANINI